MPSGRRFRVITLLSVLGALLVSLSLSGCVVAPYGYYGGGYYRPAPVYAYRYNYYRPHYW